jgi:segregation and condensation protein B
MDYFGINSAEDLPKIDEVLMEELVQATNVQDAMDEAAAENEIPGDETLLAVTIEGDIIEEVNGDNSTEETHEA